MRIRHFLLFAAVLLCAGGGVFIFTSDYRHHLTGVVFENVRAALPGLFPGRDASSGHEKIRKKKRPGRTLIENNILDRLVLLEIADAEVSIKKQRRNALVDIRAAVPRGRPVEWVMWHLSAAAAGTPYRVEDCSCTGDFSTCTIVFSNAEGRLPRIDLSISWAPRYLKASSKIAVIIKDFGFAADNRTIEYLTFPEPLTVALLPSRKLASWTAQISREYHKEIMALQPMEQCVTPRSADGRQASVIMIHFPENRVRSIIGDAADALQNVSGFMNSGGTRVLEDSRVTEIIFSEVKRRRCYFIEDRKTRKSVAWTSADKLSLPYREIDCTIDSSLDAPRIEEQIRRCAIEAQKRGQAILCSKATSAFIRSLKKQLPLLRQNGIKLSYVSELVAPGSNR